MNVYKLITAIKAKPVEDWVEAKDGDVLYAIGESPTKITNVINLIGDQFKPASIEALQYVKLDVYNKELLTVIGNMDTFPLIWSGEASLVMNDFMEFTETPTAAALRLVPYFITQRYVTRDRGAFSYRGIPIEIIPVGRSVDIISNYHFDYYSVSHAHMKGDPKIRAYIDKIRSERISGWTNE